MVTTPRGITIEGIYQLENGRIRKVLNNVVVVATENCINIGYSWNNENQ